jgi:hypothetical protein
VALAAVVALEDDDTVTLAERRARVNVLDRANALVPEVRRVVVEFEIVGRPDARTFEAYRRDLVANNGVTGGKPGIGALDQLDLSRLGNRQYYVGFAHVFVPLPPPSWDSEIILGRTAAAFNYICDPYQYSCENLALALKATFVVPKSH